MRRERIDIAALKQRFPLSTVVGAAVKLRPAGGEFVGLCPFHGERTPSFHVNDAKGLFNCFGCGASGDLIRFVQEIEGLDFIGAVRFLDSGALPELDPLERMRAAEREDAERAARIAEAQLLWSTAVDPAGTPAEIYIREAREIAELPLPTTVRFAMTPAWRDTHSGEIGPDLPALICASQDLSGEVVGVQRIFLRDGGRAKAQMKKPKRSLGRIRGCALRIGNPSRELIVCEGPEDGLTLAQALDGQAVWVALGAGLLPQIELPVDVETVTIAADNGAPGEKAARDAAEAFALQGRQVRIMRPEPGFKDWNDVHRGVRS